MNNVNDFGMLLKHERELRGIPLEEIANATKIHMRFLAALENNRFDEFPGEVFIKGYIRSYAKSIGANVETILSVYEECVGRRRADQQQAQAERNDQLSRKMVFRRNILLGGALAGILFAGFYVISKYRAPAEKSIRDSSVAAAKNELPEKAPASAGAPSGIPEDITSDQASLLQGQNIPPVLTAPEQEGEPASGSPKATEEEKATPAKAESKKETTVSPASGTMTDEPMRLRIKARENSWFNIMVDNSRQLDFILSAGETKSFSGKESFRVTIGNKKGAELVLNGRTLVLPDSDDDVVRDFQITQKLLE